MSRWSLNNEAHIATWLSLGAMGQFLSASQRDDFDQAGEARMRDLRFWGSPGPSDNLRRQRATSLGYALDEAFIDVYGAMMGADLKDGDSIATLRAAAIDAIKDALLKKGRTVASLAKIIDRLYRFPSEIIKKSAPKDDLLAAY